MDYDQVKRGNSVMIGQFLKTLGERMETAGLWLQQQSGIEDDVGIDIRGPIKLSGIWITGSVSEGVRMRDG